MLIHVFKMFPPYMYGKDYCGLTAPPTLNGHMGGEHTPERLTTERLFYSDYSRAMLL